MQKLFGAVASAAFALLTVHTAQAQDVKTIVAKTNAVYKNMKSLKVSLQTTMTMDKKGSTGVQTDGQFIPGKKAHIMVVPIPNSTFPKPAPTKNAAKKQGALVVDDGQTSYMMDVATYQYFKQPHNPNMLPIMGLKYGLPFGGMDPKAEYYKLLAPATIGGVPCYTLQLAPPSKNVTTTVLIYIDKANYHVKQAKITQSDGTRSMSAQTVVKSETVNASIADSVFTFTPPKGAQEMKPPAPPAQQPMKK